MRRLRARARDERSRPVPPDESLARRSGGVRARARRRHCRCAADWRAAASGGKHMIAADRAVQRPPDARLLVVDETGAITHARRARWLDFLHSGDLVIANDAATLPASLRGIHLRTRQPIEVRLAAWRFGSDAQGTEF